MDFIGGRKKSPFPAPPSMSRRFNHVHTFSERELIVLEEARKSWHTTPDTRRAQLIRTTTQDVLSAFRETHQGAVEPFRVARLTSAVARWLRMKCKKRSKAEQIGTKACNYRRVAYWKYKEQVLQRSQELSVQRGGSKFKYQQIALSEIIRKLPDAEIRVLKITAKHWNSSGPPENIRTL